MGITLNNEGAGGTVNVTLGRVLSLGMIGKTGYFKRKVPGKSTPHTDTSTMVASPTVYSFSAQLTTAQKAIMETFKGERQYTVLYSDNELTNKNCRAESVDLVVITGIKPGTSPNGDPYLPWVVNIKLTGLDH